MNKWLERVRTILDARENRAVAKRNPMEAETAKWGTLYRKGSTVGAGTLRLPAAIAGELARLAVCELETGVTGGARGEYLARQFAPAVENLRVWAEYGFAWGGMVLKVVPNGTELTVECIRADCFAPLDYAADGTITEAEFCEYADYQGRKFRRVERHRLADGLYEITNTVTDQSGRICPLGAVPKWAALTPGVVLEGLKKPLFVYFRTPMANSIDPDSPLGVSVYAGAVELMAQAEEQWERIQWEYKGGELAVDASEDLFEHRRDGSVVLPEGKERLFRAHDIDLGQAGGKFLEVFSPPLRDSALFCGMNNILRRIEFNCGLAYGTLSDPQNVERTAQEVRAGRQRSYATVCDLQRSLEAAMRELVAVMDCWATLGNLCPPGEFALRVCWGDSIVTDSDTLREQERKDVAAGLMTVAEYRTAWYGKEMKK